MKAAPTKTDNLLRGVVPTKYWHELVFAVVRNVIAAYKLYSCPTKLIVIPSVPGDLLGHDNYSISARDMRRVMRNKCFREYL